MSETQTNHSNDKIEAVKEPWRKAIDKLVGPFKYEEIRNSLFDSKYWFKLPDEILTFEGYVKILAYLQNLRNDIVKEKLKIDEHAGMKIAALKNMQQILPGIFSSEECKTDKLKEAKAAAELETFTILTKQADELQKIATSVLNNIDSAIAQVNRQMKAVDMGIRTSVINTTLAKDWDDTQDYDDDEPLVDSWNDLSNKGNKE